MDEETPFPVQCLPHNGASINMHSESLRIVWETGGNEPFADKPEPSNLVLLGTLYSAGGLHIPEQLISLGSSSFILNQALSIVNRILQPICTCQALTEVSCSGSSPTSLIAIAIAYRTGSDTPRSGHPASFPYDVPLSTPAARRSGISTPNPPAEAHPVGLD